MIRYLLEGRARAAALVLGAAFAAACSSSPTTNTPVDPGAPAILCPSPPDAVRAPDPSGAVVVFGAASATGGATPLTGPTCNATSGSKFPVGTTTVICTVTDAKSRSQSCSFPVVVTPAPVAPKLSVTRFLAFGDSITWGEDGRDFASGPFASGQLRPSVQLPTAETYPGALETLLRVRYTTQTPTVENAGQRNELASASSTFSRFTGWTSSGRYDVVLIMEGANDVGDRDSKIFPAVIANLQRMIRDAKSRGMKPMLATIPPENPCSTCTRGLGWSTAIGLNVEIRSLAASEAVPLVDVFNALNGDVPTYIGFDGLHPTAAGYRKIAETFLTSIRATLEVAPATTATPFRTPFVLVPPRR